MERFTKKITVLALMGMAVMMAATANAAAPKTKAECLAAAEKYDKLAAEQDAVVKEHTEMKKEFRANQALLAKGIREQALVDMDKHCDAVISTAKKLAQDYKAMAQWHRGHSEHMEQ